MMEPDKNIIDYYASEEEYYKTCEILDQMLEDMEEEEPEEPEEPEDYEEDYRYNDDWD